MAQTRENGLVGDHQQTLGKQKRRGRMGARQSDIRLGRPFKLRADVRAVGKDAMWAPSKSRARPT